MKTEKKFYVTLEWECGFDASYNKKQKLNAGFKTFDTAQQFGDTVMDNTKECNTRVANFTVCWR